MHELMMTNVDHKYVIFLLTKVAIRPKKVRSVNNSGLDLSGTWS